MKTVKSLIFFLFVVAGIGISSSKLIAGPVDWLSKFTGEINTGTDIINQSFDQVEGKSCAILYTMEKTDKKGGKTISTWEFYLSDIDENTVRFKVTGKIVTVQMNTRLGQKYIVNNENGTLDGYVSDLTILSNDVDLARAMVSAFKQNIPLCKRNEESWNNPPAAISWIKTAVGTVKQGAYEYGQTINFDDKKNYLASFDVDQKDQKEAVTKNEYNLNLADIDAKGVVLDVSGKNLSVILPVKGGNKYIHYQKNGELQNFTDKLEIVTNDMDQARSLVKAFNYLIPQLNVEYKTFGTPTEAITWLSSAISPVTIGAYKYDQKLEVLNDQGGILKLTSIKTDSKGSSTEENFMFYPADLDDKNVSVEVSGKNITINLLVKDKQKFIKDIKNKELQNYQSDVDFYADDLEKAKEIASTLEYVITKSDAGIQQFTDKNKAIAYITDEVAGISGLPDQSSQKFTIDAAADYRSDFQSTVPSSNGDITQEYYFYMADLDKASMKLVVSGKNLSVLCSAGKQKLIRVSKSGQLTGYDTDFNIGVDDVRKAKNILAALLFINSQSTVSEKSWPDGKSALAWISDQFTEINTGTSTISQKLEVSPDDPCKLKFTAVQTDSKGAQTEYVYEFNLSDIDPGQLALSISGKELTVALNAKGKQKLIKPYKNGVPQNFATSFVINSDDVLKAKQIIAAFRTACKSCK